jgi:hypothetical protein
LILHRYIIYLIISPVKRAPDFLLKVVLPVLTGGAIYIFLRPGHMFLHEWMAQLHIPLAPSNAGTDGSALYQWMIFNLPAGLWTYSMTSFILTLWNYRITKHNLPWLLAVLVISLGWELLQLAHYLAGTFDIADIITCIAAMIVSLFGIKKDWATRSASARAAIIPGLTIFVILALGCGLGNFGPSESELEEIHKQYEAPAGQQIGKNAKENRDTNILFPSANDDDAYKLDPIAEPPVPEAEPLPDSSNSPK